MKKELQISRYIIVYKFVLGLIEAVLGLGIIFFGKKTYELYINFRDVEVLEDPHDLLVRVLEKLAPYIVEHQGAIVFILLLLGLTKMIGSLGLWYHKHWGLDLLIIVTVALLPFEIFSLFLHPSLIKLSYFIINLVIALYLVNFNPHGYFIEFKKRVKET